MKKLTPFQKKVVRWIGGYVLSYIHWAQLTALLTCVISMIIFIANMSDKIWFVVVPITCAGATVFAVIGMDGIKAFWDQLPETQAVKAKEFWGNNPKYMKRIDELIREAFAQDDGGELKGALEKFKILAGKEKSLADLPNQAEKLKIEIAALEKELGMG